MKLRFGLLAAAVLSAAFLMLPSYIQAAQNVPDREGIYGSQLMTEQERRDYRERIVSASSAQEREQIRAEHHERMQARAKERGLSLPDMPSETGRGGRMPNAPGMGRGAGPGMGPGSGMGPGRGMDQDDSQGPRRGRTPTPRGSGAQR